MKLNMFRIYCEDSLAELMNLMDARDGQRSWSDDLLFSYAFSEQDVIQFPWLKSMSYSDSVLSCQIDGDVTKRLCVVEKVSIITSGRSSDLPDRAKVLELLATFGTLLVQVQVDADCADLHAVYLGGIWEALASATVRHDIVSHKA